MTGWPVPADEAAGAGAIRLADGHHDGCIALSTAQLAALLDGCEWRAPVPRRRPELAG
jgi:hypothetical protein